MRNQARKWLEVDIRVRLERVLYWSAETRLAVKEASELAESQLEKIKASQYNHLAIADNRLRELKKPI